MQVSAYSLCFLGVILLVSTSCHLTGVEHNHNILNTRVDYTADDLSNHDSHAQDQNDKSKFSYKSRRCLTWCTIQKSECYMLYSFNKGHKVDAILENMLRCDVVEKSCRHECIRYVSNTHN